MFKIDSDKTIYLTRGDIATINVSAVKSGGEAYMFQVGDVVRIKVTEKKNCEKVVLEKDVEVYMEAEEVVIQLNRVDTKIGEVISKPKDYWYEIELNPETYPQTIIGYDDDGAKLLRLFPEGSDEV
jgi:hypothetical protein